MATMTYAEMEKKHWEIYWQMWKELDSVSKPTLYDEQEDEIRNGVWNIKSLYLEEIAKRDAKICELEMKLRQLTVFPARIPGGDCSVSC